MINEEKIAALETENAELSKKVGELETQNADLSEKVDSLTNELTQFNKEPKDVSKLKEMVKELRKENLDLSEKLSQAEKNTEKAGLKIVTNSEGKQFKLATDKFRFDGKIVSYDELKKSPEMVDQLLKKGSGLITQLS